MKITTPKQTVITGSVANVVAGATGILASNGIVNMLGVKKTPVLHGALALGCLVVASAVEGKDTGAEIVRGAFLGASVSQTAMLGSQLLRDNMPAVENEKATKFLEGAAGLGYYIDNDYSPYNYEALNSYDIEPELEHETEIELNTIQTFN